MDFKIPSKFYLNGMKINVNLVDSIKNEASNCDGMAYYYEGKIDIKNDPLYTDDYKEFIFFHELIHHLFNNIEEHKLRGDEKLVSRLARALHQSIKTME